MVILKKIIIMTEHNKSNCSGIVKFENFAGRTSCFVRILGLNGNGLMCIKSGDNIMYCGNLFDGEHTFNALYDLNKTIQIVVVADGSIVCMGSNKGRFSPNAIMTDIHRYYASISQVIERPTDIRDVNAQQPVEQTSIRQEAIRQEPIRQEQIRRDRVEEQIIDVEIELPHVEENKHIQDIQQEVVTPKVEEKTEQITQGKKTSKAKTVEPFYKKIEKNLSELFDTHQKDEELTLLIPSSKWVRVPIEGDGYYVVGVIENDGVPDIICYGVPDKDDSNPPQNSSDCRQWMEIEKGGRGYWMMYQSAISGETLTTTII
ncbi:MAG: hypothetical protein K2M75_06245 [Clostridia bacterium]|nr:hypothetical protein [Clostridia bacterium]